MLQLTQGVSLKDSLTLTYNARDLIFEFNGTFVLSDEYKYII